MKIKKLILEGFDPLETGSGIKRFEWNLQNIIQILLGTNGSGKSQIFRVASPMPATSKYFNPNGLHEFHCEDKGTDYILKSSFDAKGKATYSFYNLTTGEELNPGGKITIQKDLVLKHFNYTESLHNILIGKINFSQMSLQARKDLLLKVSDVDLTYAIDMFEKLSRSFRDAVGAYKHVKAKVDQLGAEVVSDDVLNATLKRKDAIIESVHSLRSFLETRIHSGNEHAEINQVDEEFESIVHDLELSFKHISTYLNGRQLTDKLVEETLTSLEDVNRRVAIYENKYEETAKQVEKINEVALKLDALDVEDASGNLDVRIGDSERLIAQLESRVKPSPFNFKRTHTITSALCESTASTLAEIKIGMDETINFIERPEALQIVEAKKFHDKTMEDLKASRDSCESFLREIIVASQGNVVCSNCGHETLASEHSSKECIEETRAKLERLNADVSDYEKVIAEFNKTKWENFVKLSSLINEVKEVISKSDNVKLIISALSDTGSISYLDIAKHFSRYIAKLNENAVNEQYLSDLEDERKHLNDLKEYKELMSLGVMQKAEELEVSMANLVDNLDALGKEKRGLDTFVDGYRAFNKITSEHLPKAIDYLGRVSVGMLDKELCDEARRKLNELSAELIVIEEVIFNAKNKSSILESANKEHLELDRKRQALKNLTLAMSPKTGIIGDALRNVLETFCEDVNDYIGRVWTYDMSVVPYASLNTLDFRMPLKVRGKQIEDISEASLGQREFIDFVIRLCIMVYMGLEDHPLFMDEVGPHLDATHKEELHKFTLELSISGMYSNVLLISHFASQYGSHVNSDIVVLNPDNIIVPDKFNEHTIVE